MTINISNPHGINQENCWKSIGIRGDKSCPALAEYAHCRNCPAYTQIAATLLNRVPVEQDTRSALLSDGSHQSDTNLSSGTRSTDQYILAFRLGKEWLGISMSALDEVVELSSIHSIPHRPNPVLLGITNVRGELIICTSLARLLGSEADASVVHKVKRLLILRSTSGRLAVPVDEIQHAFTYHPNDMVPPPSTVALASNSYTIGMVQWQGRTVAHIDATKVITAFERCLG